MYEYFNSYLQNISKKTTEFEKKTKLYTKQLHFLYTYIFVKTELITKLFSI